MTAPKSNTIWVVALLLSVGLNGLIGGYLISDRLAGPKAPAVSADQQIDPRDDRRTKGPRATPRGGLKLSTILRYLPNEDRRVLRNEIKIVLEGQDGPDPRAIFDEEQKVIDIAGAAAFDEVALREAITKLHQRRQAHNAVLDEVVITYLAKMPEEKRTELFAKFTEDRAQMRERWERRRERRNRP